MLPHEVVDTLNGVRHVDILAARVPVAEADAWYLGIDAKVCRQRSTAAERA
jgi:hypothetical protein